MDKNQIIGLVAISAIIIGYMIWSQPSKEELAKMRQEDSLEVVKQNRAQDSLFVANERWKQDSIKKAELIDTVLFTNDTADSDSLQYQKLVKLYGDFANASKGKEEFIIIKNDKVEIKITTKGGRVYSANLLNYKTHNQTDLLLFDGDQNKFNLDFLSQNKLISTQNFYFEPQSEKKVLDATDDTKILNMRLKADDRRYLEYSYSLSPGSYILDFDINFVNTEDLIFGGTTFIDLAWNSYIPHLEHGKKFELQNTSLYYQLLENDVNQLKVKKHLSEKELTTKVKWIGYKQQFFSSVLIAKSSFNDVTVTQQNVGEDDTLNLKYMTSKISLPYKHGAKKVSIPLAFYFGPNKYTDLLKISVSEGDDLNMHKLVPLGWGIFGWVNRLAIIPLFNFLGTFISSYGIIILVMTLLIKSILFPLTYRSFLSSAKMRVLKPEIEKINKKIAKEKSMERQQATMALYKKAGVNPMGGCIPVALQFPILIAMFRFFPASIELRQQGFLWATDLSSYDSIYSWTTQIPYLSQYYGNHISLFTLLMALAIVGSTILNGNQMQDNNPQAKTMKYMMYFMPVMMIFWFNNYSAGLSFYYLLSNLITIVQTLIMRRFVNEDKLFSKLQANVSKSKKKDSKKSNFQKKLEGMAKQRGYTPPKKDKKKNTKNNKKKF